MNGLERTAGETAALRCELVDSWHGRWGKVLAAIESSGHRALLRIDPDGGLSARRGVFAAFDGDALAGYLGFHLCCSVRGADPVRSGGRLRMRAKIDCLHVEPAYASAGTQTMLQDVAASFAGNLYDELVGFGI